VWSSDQDLPYDPNGSLVKVLDGSGAIYMHDYYNGPGGTGFYLRHIVDPTSFNAWGFSGSWPATWGSTYGVPIGADWPYRPSVVRDPSNGAIYVLDL
jgi:hypothetical protein